MRMYYWPVFFFLVVCLVSYSVVMTHDAGVSAEDWNRHSIWIAEDMAGRWTPLSMYLPAFHLFMIPFVLALGTDIAAAQVLLFGLVIISLFLYAWRWHGRAGTLVMLALMVSSELFLMYYSSLMPDTTDLIILPFLMTFYFSRKYVPASLALLFLVYSHLFGIVFFVAIAFYSFAWRREYLKYLAVVIVLSLPAALYYVPSFLGIFSGYNSYGEAVPAYGSQLQVWTNPENQFFQNPYIFTLFSGGILLLFPYALWRIVRQPRLTQQQRFYMVLLLAFLPVLFFDWLRAWTYMLVPILLLEASSIEV